MLSIRRSHRLTMDSLGWKPTSAWHLFDSLFSLHANIFQLPIRRLHGMDFSDRFAIAQVDPTLVLEVRLVRTKENALLRGFRFRPMSVSRMSGAPYPVTLRLAFGSNSATKLFAVFLRCRCSSTDNHCSIIGVAPSLRPSFG